MPIARGSLRVLSPAEARAIRSVIGPSSSRALFDVLLYTGLRYAEVRQLAADPSIFDEGNGTLTILSLKTAPRDVILGERGRPAVETFLELGARMPKQVSNWQRNMTRWSKVAKLAPLPHPTAAGNPYGVTVSTTRKTWASWLLAEHPEWLTDVVLSQGHRETTAMNQYTNLAWTAADREAIRLEVAGWRPRRPCRPLLHTGESQGSREQGDAVVKPASGHPDALEEVIRLRAEGATVLRIAALTGVSPDDVRSWLLRAGIRKRCRSAHTGRVREVLDVRGAELIAAYQAGTSARLLAADAGMTPGTLKLYLAAEGVALRDERGRPRKRSD